MSARSRTALTVRGTPPRDRPAARDRLNLRQPLVIGLRELPRRPGEQMSLQRRVVLDEPLGLELVHVAAGTTVTVDLTLQSATEGVLVTSTVRAPATGECARCLTGLEVDITADVVELFAYPHSLTEQTTDPDEIYRVGLADDASLAIDVAPMMRDAIVLNLPWQPLCRPDCAGLCVDCGQPLADLPADHSHASVDPRWAALAGALAPAGSGSEPDNHFPTTPAN